MCTSLEHKGNNVAHINNQEDRRERTSTSTRTSACANLNGALRPDPARIHLEDVIDDELAEYTNVNTFVDSLESLSEDIDWILRLFIS